MEKRISTLLFAIIALICMPLLSSCSDNDTPEGEKLQNKLSGGVWKIEQTSGTVEPQTYVLYVNLLHNLLNNELTMEWGLKNLHAADFFESVSDKEGLRYYQYMHTDVLPTNAYWYVIGNTIGMTFYEPFKYHGDKELHFTISAQGVAKNSVDGIIKINDNKSDPNRSAPIIPFPKGLITMTRSSEAEMNAFIEETKKSGTDGYAQ